MGELGNNLTIERTKGYPHNVAIASLWVCIWGGGLLSDSGPLTSRDIPNSSPNTMAIDF